MTNIEDYINNFTDAFEKVSKRLVNLDDEIYQEFDNLEKSDKLFLFAKKLIMDNNDFLNVKRITDLEKEVEEKNKRLIQIQEELKSKNDELLEANNLYKVKISLCNNKYKGIIDNIKKKNSIIYEDCYAFKLKFNMYKNMHQDLLKKHDLHISQLKEKIREKINDFT